MSHDLIRIPVLPCTEIRSWPKHVDGGTATYTLLAEALTRDYATDAHFTAYSVPELDRRLGLDALKQVEAIQALPGGVAMVLFVVDVDCAAAHKGDPAAADEWWLDEQGKLTALLARHPGGFVYRTRGGYRLVYVLPAPVVLRDDADAVVWSLTYCIWIAYLKRDFGIEADAACKDWTRLFRLPHATRDEGRQPERRETVGNAAAIGTWICHPTDADRAEAARMRRRKPPKARRPPPANGVVAVAPKEGVLLRLFTMAGALGAEVRPGVFSVACPNEAAHTMGERHDGSTVLFPPGAGEIFGHVHCQHGHCTDLTLAQVLRTFPAHEVDAAREEIRGLVKAEQDAAKAVFLAARDAGRVTVLVPGEHAKEGAAAQEVGTAQFASEVLAALPEDAIYRMDFVVGQIVGKPGERRFEEIDDTATRLLVDTFVRLARRVLLKDGIVEIYVPCSRDLASLVRSAAGSCAKVRALRQITHYPTYLPGFVLAQPGWNAAGGVFYDEPPDLGGLVPRSGVALIILDDLVVDWPFVDAASRQNTYGMMLTAILRPAIEGAIPLFLVMAALERTGKGKLIDTTLGYAVHGRPVEMIQLGTEEAEREKRITALMLRGGSAIHIDNLSQGERLDSAAVASMATAWPTWGGRLLGVSKAPQLPNAAVWVASGNNIQAAGELVKRGCPIFLQPLDEHPELRTDFRHEDPYAYALIRRRTVLEALLGMVEDWKAAGQPGCDVRMGGFERWVAAVGGCLRHAGAKDWMTNYTTWITSADDTQVDTEVLVNAWAARYGTAVVTAAELLTLVEDTGAFRWVLTKETAMGRLVAFSRKVLVGLVNRPVKGWIVRRATSGSSATYCLEKGNR